MSTPSTGTAWRRLAVLALALGAAFGVGAAAGAVVPDVHDTPVDQPHDPGSGHHTGSGHDAELDDGHGNG